VVHLHLTRKPHIRRHILDARQAFRFGRGHRSGITSQNLHPAGRATSISATAMQDIDSTLFERQNETASRLGNDRVGLPFNHDDRHVACSFVYALSAPFAKA